MAKHGILIVEDEGIVAESIKIALKNFGYEVIGISSSGPDALEKVFNLKPDLILMDIMLKGPMDGIEAACEIKKTFDTAIIFLTAYGDDEILNRAKSADPFGYLIKPFEERELRATIEMALQKSMLEKKIIHLSGMLRAIRNINQKIIKEKDIQELLDFSVNSLTSTRGYNSTWIVLFDKERKVTHFAQSGIEYGFDEIVMLINKGEGITCYLHSIEDPNAYIIENPQTECYKCPLANNYDGKKVVTIPLISNSINYGVLTISVEENYCNPEELSLLEEVAGDIAFCVYNSELEAKQKASVEEIKRSENRYRLLFDNFIVGIYKSNINGDITDCNQAFANMLGYETIDEVLKINAEDLYYKKGGRKQFLNQMENAINEAVGEIQLKTKGGKPVWFLESVKILEDKSFQGTVINITEKKNAEARQEKLLNTLTQRVKEMSCLNAINEICHKNTLTIYEILQRTVEALPFGFQHSSVASARVRLHEYEVSTNNCEETKWFLQEFFHYNSGNRGIIEVFYREQMPFQEIGPFFSEEQNLLKNVASILSETIQRRNAETNLKESEDKFLAITKAAQDAIVMIDERGRAVYFNKAAEEIFGYSEKEIIGLPLHEFIAPDRYEKQYSEGMSKFSKTGEGAVLGKVVELMAKKKSGNEFPVEVSLSGVQMKGAWHGVGLVRDITNRKLAEKALIESEERFRGMFENSTIGLYRTTPNGEILLANPALLSMLGYESFQDLLKIGSIDNSYVQSHNRKRYTDILENEGVIYGYEEDWKRKDGTVIQIRESARCIRNEKNETMFYEGVVEDITISKTYEKALIEAKERAEESSRLKTSILTNMSHELRTPLVGILGFAEVLRNEMSNSDQKNMAGQIFVSGKRLSNTLNSILNLSKIEASNIPVCITSVDPLPLIDKVILSYAEIVDQKGIYLKVINKTQGSISLDKDLFEQGLGFLVDNGVKYTGSGGVTIEVCDEGYDGTRYRLVKVIDTGCGIAKENQKQIFDQFRQVSEGHSRSFQGLGLGLSIAKKFVNLMNGELLLESDLGKGSTFIMRFPLNEKETLINGAKEDAAIEKSYEIENGKDSEKTKPKILYVEDDEVNISVTKLFLKNYYMVDVALNGDSAIECVKQNEYEAILMDINLGEGMNGKDVTKEIREIPGYESIPIIAVTAFAMDGDKEEFIRAGCSHYLAKPFSRKDLLELLEDALR